MTIRGVLWDFGNTLADQDWLLQPLDCAPDWAQVWTEIARGSQEEAWYRNEVTCVEIVARVAECLGLPDQTVLDHVRDCCTRVTFFPGTLQIAKDLQLPQALVTVNSDIFSESVVPHYRLDALFPVIVTSWEERTVDKGALCLAAIRRWEQPLPPEEVLLIDNTASALEAWERAGGQTYLYRGEEQFLSDLDGGLRELKESTSR